MSEMPLAVIKFVLKLRRRHNRDMDIEHQRLDLEKMASKFPLAPGMYGEPVDVDGLCGEWLYSGDENPDAAILYLHGGGYAMGSINTHRSLTSRIARAAQARVLAVNYRLAPENPFPAAIEDAEASYLWLLKQGFKAQHLAIAGDSAGGGLTIATLLSLREHGHQMPAAAVCLSPWVDLTACSESITTKAQVDPMISKDLLMDMAQMYLGDRDRHLPLASPIYADLRGLPPLLLQVGSAEILLDDAKSLAEKAKAAGVEVDLEIWENMIHVWHFFARFFAEGQQAIDKIGTFIRSQASNKR